jgi:hypothetical protein
MSHDLTESTAWVATLRRPWPVQAYLVGALAVGATALFGGGLLVADPSGDAMGMPVEWLQGTPFADYLVPGLVLFSVLGVGALVVAGGVLTRKPWAARGALALGVALIGWIVVQMLLIQRVHVLHAVYGGLGVALAVLATRPSFRADVDGPDAVH